MSRVTIAIRPATPRAGLARTALGGALLLAAGVLPAAAQNAGCTDIQKTLLERKELVSTANASAGSKKKISAPAACSLFTKLVANGSAGLKWIEANREWCSIPDSFADGFKADHGRVMQLRTKICGAAAQQAVMERKARQQAQNGGGASSGLLGGPGLTGATRMPSGAL